MNETPRILIVEDDPAIRQGLIDTLESESYEVLEAGTGTDAIPLLKTESIDLVLLDLMMPGKSGYEVCRELRTFNQTLPVLMLTAKGEEIDKVLGLELGADDYMTKPFGVRELLARVHALLRRSQLHTSSPPSSEEKTAFSFGNNTVDPKSYSVKRGEDEWDLTSRELELLRIFHAHPCEVLSRDELLNQAWGMEYYGTTRTLDQHIAQLRKKVETCPGTPALIQTVHGVGYRFVPPTSC